MWWPFGPSRRVKALMQQTQEIRNMNDAIAQLTAAVAALTDQVGKVVAYLAANPPGQPVDPAPILAAVQGLGALQQQLAALVPPAP